ncbi:activating molecule in BECN1-regulated autophagy protein 1-like isoform X2 [Frieseomelitta varia]|uniref:activating molecule in BECN1-regulated autophagy protein 1-like isoform X2 n=1 Tax=Frieseomelitta varia TaxID=561572 RepID=UPI001CB67EDB|nr:activating molecule in BECN1-regulated autophagy protein 1-like isoform X2 [Frieseomelitta varia]
MEQVKKRPELLHCSQSRNILRDLMLRDFGFLYYNCYKTKTRALESIAEMNLVGKKHKELEYDLPGYPKATFLMVFSPDGTKMASAHGNHSIYITDMATRKNIKILSGHPRTPWCIAFHPSSSHILASGCLGGQVRIWDLRDGSKIWNTESQTVIASLAFHPSEKLLVIATNNEIHFWDWSQSKPFAIISTKTSIEKVRYVAFDNLGKKLITGIGNCPREPKSFRSCLRYGRTAHDSQVLSNYGGTLIVQSEAIQTIGTEPSHSTRSNFRGTISVDNNELLQYICNTGRRTGRGRGEFPRDDDETPVPEDVSAVVLNFLGISGRNYRIQAWDFSKGEIPDIKNSEKNIVIHKCKIRNDASINISSDGTLLATCFVGAAGVYSLQWETLGREIYWTKVYNSVISVSISPTQEHLLVGLARNKFGNDYTMAVIYRLTRKQFENDKLFIRDLDLEVRDLLQNNHPTRAHTSINCIRWAPQPGQGLIYATNTGRLAILH